MTAPAVLLYCRVSKDKDGTSTSVDDQAAAMAVICDRLGLPIGRTIKETGSASEFRTNAREGWVDVETEIKSGRWTHFAAWALSRQSRDLAEWATFRNLCRQHGVRWITRTGQILDLTDSGTRIGLGVQAILGEEYVQELSDAVRRTLNSRATDGLPHGRNGYGYSRTYNAKGKVTGAVIVREEADVLRWAAAWALKCTDLRALVRILNDGGVPSPAQAIRARTGEEPGEGKWDSTALRKLLLSPRSAGLREHHGKLTPGQWEGIWTPVYRGRLIKVLTDPKRNDRKGRPGAIAHWLSGALVCDICDDPMRHRAANGGTYGCAGCTKVSIRASAIETELFGFLTVAVDPGFLRRRADPRIGSLRAERDELSARLEEIEAAILAGDMPAVMGGRMANNLTQQVAALTDELDSLTGPTPLDIPTPDELVRDWDSMSPAQRRTLWLHVVGRVRITPAGRSRWLHPMSRVSMPDADEKMRALAAQMATPYLRNTA